MLPAFVATAAEKLSFNRDVRPILAENCFACHGPDSASRKAGLRLDRREVAVKAGAIAPGKPDESEMIHRIFATDNDEVMPPPSIHKQLTAAQKETLKAWIAAGAEYQPLWSFIPPARPALPAVHDAGWVRNPIDRFVLAALEQRGLQPAAEADRRTLARRLSLDLTGLPPSPEMVEAFVDDKSPDAYEKLVERLMQSPQWGEHRARYWLDAARYADTNGIHFDNYREIWSFRDWVIDAFNQNMPFDRFTIEQLAGDLLPNASDEQRIATGFNRCNITTNEGGAIGEEYLVLYTRDRTETTSRVWMGLTANCAVCHDHKFDPLPQKEFYSLSAFFNNTTQAAMDGNVKDTPPVMFVAGTPEDRKRWKTIDGQIAELKKQIDDRKQAARADFEKWVAGPARQSLVGQGARRRLEVSRSLERGPGPQRGDYGRFEAPHVGPCGRRGLEPRRGGRQGLHGPGQDPAGNRRGGRPRQPAGIFLRGLGQALRQGRQRGGAGPHGRRQRLPRLGHVVGERPSRGAFDQSLARQRHQGRLARRRFSRASGIM